MMKLIQMLIAMQVSLVPIEIKDNVG